MNFLIETGGIVVIIVVVVLLLLVIWFIGVYNKLKQISEKVNEAESGIDVALEKRFDELTKMLDVTKGYAKHESETLAKVISMRTGYDKNASAVEKTAQADKIADEVSRGINVVVEKYPELKADSMFKNLQAAIADVEEHLQAARRLFNSNVQSLNKIIVTFPNSLVASMAHISKRDYFKGTEAKKDDPKMNF